MSEAQALKPDTEIEIVEDDIETVALEVEQEEEIKPSEPEAIKIEVEDSGKPPERRLSGFEKRLRKKDEKVAQAEAEAEALREENKLLRLAQQQSALEEPDPDTFEGTDEELKAAQRAWNQQEIKRIAAEEAQALFDQSQQDRTRASQAQRIDGAINEHYKRADSLNVSNYDELEGNATDILGEDFVKTIIASTDDAHRILASMGASPGKTTAIAQLAQTDAPRAFANALRFEIHPSLKPASLKSTPDPEEQVDPGSGVTSTIPGLEGVKFE